MGATRIRARLKVPFSQELPPELPPKGKRSCPQMALSDIQVRNAKRGPKTQRLWDEKGLYLEISPAKPTKEGDAIGFNARAAKAPAKDGKWWRLKYRFNGTEKRLALGPY